MSMSLNTAISAYAAMANSARLNTEPHVTRRRRISDCSGAPSSARNRPRTSSSSTSWSASAARARPGIAASCTYGSTGNSPSSPSARRAAAAARSSPTSSSDTHRTWARSCSMSDSSAATVADERSPKPIVPSSRATSRSRSTRPWAMPASWRRRRSYHSASMAASRAVPVQAAERHAIGPDDDERVALPGAAGGDQPGHAHAGAVGEEGHEPFVLDELQAAQAHGALGVAVPGQPPRVGEQLAVPGVTPVHLHRQRPVLVGGIELQRPLRVHRRRGQLVDADPEAFQRDPDARRRRAAARRTDRQVDGGRGEQADGDGGDATGGGRRPEQHRPEQLQPDEPPPEVAERLRHVR